MNKENQISSSSSSVAQAKKNDKKPKSYSTYIMQAMPHKQIDLNASKKNSAANSPQNFQQQQTQPLQVLQSNFTQALSANATAGTLQRQFMEQKLIENQTATLEIKCNPPSQTSKNKKGEATNLFTSFGGTADSGSFQNSSFNNSQTATQKNGGGFKQNLGQSSKGEIDNNQNAFSQIQKQHSCATIDDHGGSRCYSVFSKSSFATSSSFLFGTRIFNKAQKSVPKVNMSTIFKNKAYLYLDEALINTFDDLLDKGYEIVTSKKEERDILKEQEEAMKNECTALEKEITPLIQRSQQCNEQIIHQVGVQKQYEKEIWNLQDELSQLQQQIQARTNEISNTYDEFTNMIKQMEIDNNKIRSDININKACHRQEANSQQQIKKQRENKMRDYTDLLLQLKSEYENKKMVQADRLRKMENKQKMYIGILKH